MSNPKIQGEGGWLDDDIDWHDAYRKVDDLEDVFEDGSNSMDGIPTERSLPISSYLTSTQKDGFSNVTKSYSIPWKMNNPPKFYPWLKLSRPEDVIPMFW